MSPSTSRTRSARRARRVRYYAPIRTVSRSRRIDLLSEEPGHPRAMEWYIRFDLGPVESLPRPIYSARGRRILFIRTSWEKIGLAEDINDLFIGSAIEEPLFLRLRQAGLLPEREFHVEVKNALRPRSTKHYFLDFAIFCPQRNLDIECDGDTWHARRERIARDNERDNLLQANLWQVLRFNTRQIMERMEETLEVIHDAVNRYGGVVQPDLIVRQFGPSGRLAPGQGTLDLEG